MPRRPPDILRKSHRHTEGDDRSRAKRALARELDEAETDAPDETGAGEPDEAREPGEADAAGRDATETGQERDAAPTDLHRRRDSR